MNELVAVDLQAFSTGLRVSRRHVIIYEQEGVYFVESLSSNPASLLRTSPSGDGSEQAVELTETRVPLLSGDVIRLERSAILLKFIVRDSAAPPKGPAEEPEVGQTEEGV
jgi:pSer/pThr/pTyr-binding forkhead associated (FHA) protein